jgi:hypothetical protein
MVAERLVPPHRTSQGRFSRAKFSALLAAVAFVAFAVPASAQANSYDHGPWTLVSTPYTFTSQMTVGGPPNDIDDYLRNDNAHSGGYRVMKCDGTTTISDYADFPAHDKGNWHYLATNVVSGTCFRARGYSKWTGGSFVTYPTFLS